MSNMQQIPANQTGQSNQSNSNSSSARAMFEEGISALVIGTILPLISDCLLRERQVQVTPEEMIQWLELPVSAPRTPNIPGAFQVPNAFRTPTGSTPTTTTRSVRRKEPDANAPRCVYVFQRGIKRGQPCGEAAVPGTQYCKNCARKKGVQAVVNGGAPPANPTRGSAQTSTNSRSQPQQQQQQQQIDVVGLPGRVGYYKVLDTGLIIRQLEGGDVMAVAILDAEGNECPLSEDDKILANNSGFLVEENPEDQSNQDNSQFSQEQQTDQQYEEQQEPIATSTPLMPSFNSPIQPRRQSPPSGGKPSLPQPGSGMTMPSLNAPSFKPPVLGGGSLSGLPRLS